LDEAETILSTESRLKALSGGDKIFAISRKKRQPGTLKAQLALDVLGIRPGMAGSFYLQLNGAMLSFYRRHR